VIVRSARGPDWVSWAGLAAILALIGLGAWLVGAEVVSRAAFRHAAALTGDPVRGRTLAAERGCGGCHTIPGVPRATGLVGPSLERVARRVYVGGVLANSPSNMIRWLRDPPAVDPPTAMPNLRLDPAEARDVAAYLYTLE
jgi:mono/diheme cytochrome c family protein